MGDSIANLEGDPYDKYVETTVLKDTISHLIYSAGLTRKEKFVLSFRNGLDLNELHGIWVDNILYDSFAAYDKNMTLEDVGEIFGITRERIRQIEAKAYVKIREKLQVIGIDSAADLL